MPLIVAAAGVGSLAALKFLPTPYAWIGLWWVCAGVAVAVRARPRAVRLTGLCVSAAAGVLGGAEIWLARRPAPLAPSTEPSATFQERDSLLGWRLVPDRSTRVVKRAGDTVLYDVAYGTDGAGRRRAYPDTGRPAAGCVWFFTCSFAFGEGVPDTATLPYRLGAQTAGRYRTVNFGAPGYGAEHMLAYLERGDQGAACAPTHIIYQALPHHIVRAAGKPAYSRRGPRYRVTDDGIVTYSRTGSPDTVASPLWTKLHDQLRKSRIFQAVAQRPARFDPRDLRLYLGIVRRAREIAGDRYPGARFDVLAWNLHQHYAGSFAAFRDSLARVTPNLHLVSDALAGYDTTPSRYEIHPSDAHPNALAYDLLAGYVLREILTAPTLSSAGSAPR